ARGQDPPPKIGPYVVDVHGIMPRFPDADSLAASHDVVVAELPGRGLGVQLAGTVYVFRWRAVTFGFGGEFANSSARTSPDASPTTTVRATEERFRTVGTQLSFNFGSGTGWSYLSGGIGQST